MIKKGSKRAEMTFPVLVAIVIGLVLIAIMIYMLSGKSRDLSTGTSCLPEDCSAHDNNKNYEEKCPPEKVKSYTPCKVGSGKDAKPGFCCVPE